MKSLFTFTTCELTMMLLLTSTDMGIELTPTMTDMLLTSTEVAKVLTPKLTEALLTPTVVVIVLMPTSF